MTTPSLLPVCLACAALMLAPQRLAAAPAVKDLAALKSLQNKVSAVVEKVQPATVSLFSARSGASGSGVVVSRDGLILTAGHVVHGAEEMTVTFPNGKQARGKVLGANYTRDSAMVRILDKAPAGGWPHAEIGRSKGLSSGDFVIALGHAGGYDPVRTPPVRFGRMIARAPNQFFSTDCTLIGGDSGGPLFDLDGRVIGIHSSIGHLLAVNNHASIEGFRQDWKKLLRGDSWGRLGGSPLLDNPDAPALGIISSQSGRGGVLVNHVIKGGPALKAGLRAGDVIRSINGRATPNLRVLHAIIASLNPGDIARIRLTRRGKNITRNVRLGRRGDLLPDETP